MNCTTTVKQVQLYRSGCTVKRSGTVHLEKGTTHVVIEGMTESAEGTSFSLHFPENIKGSAIRLETAVFDKVGEKESDRKAEELKIVDEQISVLQEQARLYREILSPEGGELKDKASFIQEFPKVMAENAAAVRELRRERVKLNDELNELRKQENSPKIHIHLTADAEGDYPFMLEYRETAASWRPLYEIRSEGEGEPVEFRVRAQAFQSTQEDWKNIELSLMTGNPSFSCSVPVLMPSLITFYTTPSYPRPSAKASGSAKFARLANFMAEEEADYAMESPYEMGDTAVLSGDTTQLSRIITPEAEVVSDTVTEYKLSGTRDFPKGADGILVDLQTFSADAEYRVITVPSADTNAYLCATVKTADLPIVMNDGAMVYLKGNYIGTIYISPDMTEETFDITLGKDDRISVVRKQLKRKTLESKLRGTKTREYEYETKITSSRPEPVTVILKDQVPMSQEKSITVETTQLSGGVRNEDTGIVEWTLTAEPHETIVKNLAYSITWPKDKTITGY